MRASRAFGKDFVYGGCDSNLTVALKRVQHNRLCRAAVAAQRELLRETANSRIEKRY